MDILQNYQNKFKNKFLQHSDFIHTLIIIGILFIIFLCRIPFLSQPLDRDSGVFALIGATQHQGYIDYKDYFETKPPGLHLLFFWLFKFFPPTDIIVNLFVAFWTILNTALFYLLAVALFNNFTVASFAALTYGLFSTSPFIEGNMAVVENFMVTFNIFGFYLLLLIKEKRQLWLCILIGLSFGIASIFKQVAIFDCLAALCFLAIIMLFRNDKIFVFIKKILCFCLAFIAPWLIALIYFKRKGAFDDFLFYCFQHNFKYIKLMGYSSGNYWKSFFHLNFNILKTNLMVWTGPLFIVIYAAKRLLQKKEKISDGKTMILLWSIFSFIGLCSSGRFFPHYYIAILPSFTLATFFMLTWVRFELFSAARRMLIFSCLISSILLSFYFHYDYYFKFSPEEISKHQYGWEPFVEAKQIGIYIKEHTSPKDFIFIWAEEPEIHFYSMRNSVCKFWSNVNFVYFSSIYKDAEDILLSGLKTNRPIYVVVDSRHINILKRYPLINEFFRANYKIENEFKIIRDNVWGYSLLLLRLKDVILFKF